MRRSTRFLLPVLMLFLAATTLLIAGCSSKPSDSELTANVQKQLQADPSLQNQAISVTAKDGTVTLSGTVSDQGFRDLASRDTSGIKGVRTVVNNISVGDVTPAMAAQAAETTANSVASQAATKPVNNAPARKPAPPAQPAPPPPAAAPARSASLVIPSGTRIEVRLGQTLSSKTSQTGDSFSGTVVNPVRVDGRTVIPAGASAHGVVTEAKDRGRFKGEAVLALRLDSVRTGGRTYDVQTSRIERAEKGKGKRTAVMTGGGAGLGALIGGLAGGGKGALIGGLVGAGGGAAGSAFTGNHDLELPAETVLTFVLENSVTIR